ncbi:MAG: phosphoglycolate phosphatase [Rhodobacter sp.]|nr:phosphoglycolate phosphatase [Rhodobacter sp.]
MSGIIFDLDGTLIDSAPDIHAGIVQMLRAENLPETTFEQTKSFIGKGVPALIAQVLAAKDIDEDADQIARMTRHFHEIYETRINLTTLYPGAESCLRNLHADGFQLGLCTNKPEAPTNAVLEHFGLSDLFTGFSFGDGPYPAKPDAAPVRHVIDQLSARHFLYVGDSETDAETATNAGLPMALFTEGYRKTPVTEIRHDAIFNHFGQLRGIIDRLAPRPE